MAFVDTLVLLVALVGLSFFQVSAVLWSFVILSLLLIISFFGTISTPVLFIYWFLAISVVGFLFLSSLRIKFFTTPLFSFLQKQMPKISQTEAEAIAAGNVWWEKDLFCGRPDWKHFLALPTSKLSKEEQHFLDNQVETLCSLLDDWKIVSSEKNLSEEAWEYIKKERFFGLVIPKEYGGHGFSALAHSSVVTKIATRSLSAAINTMVPNSLGPAELILHYGTDEQKEYYLPRLAKAEEIPCFALTGPEAGSDAGSITDYGIVCRGQINGKEVLGIRLTWDKRYITLAPMATVLGLAFRLYDPEFLLGKTEDIGITLCLIPTSTPGVEIGNRHLPLYLAFMNGPTKGKDVFIPIDWIIGGPERAGQGWKMLMECLSIGRSISLPALSTACGKLAFRMTGGYSRIRKQFNTAIASFEGVEEALGNIAGMTYTLEATRILTCSAVDQNTRPSIASAIAKHHMTEMARKVIAHAMDVHAGHMIQVGPKNFLAHAHIGIPVSITVEGANILTRNLIIFGQGAIRCHPFVLKEVELLAQNPSDSNLKQLDFYLLKHAAYYISNLVRSFVYGVTFGRFISSPVQGPAAPYYRQLTRMSAALALLSDLSMMVLGGNLKRKERLSARLGDMLSELYLASAVLKYYHEQRNQKADRSFMKWSVETCLYHIQVAIDEFLNNFPQRWARVFFNFIIFPFGKSYRKPKDKLSRRMVKTMLAPSSFRDRLTEFCYLGREPEETTQQIEQALAKIKDIDPIWQKIQIAQRKGGLAKQARGKNRIETAVQTGVINKEEGRMLHEFEELHQKIIKVDEFSFDLKSVI